MHDIRNDLNALELEVTLIEEGEGPTSARKDELRQLRKTIRGIEVRLRMLSGRFQDLTPAMTRTRAEDVYENIMVLARQAGLLGDEAKWQFAASNVIVDADVDLLSEALFEILKNAADFSETGKSPAVAFTVAGNQLRMAVRESKLAAPQNLNSWEKPFIRSRSGAYSLGLHHAARIVAVHHGKIERHFDEGTTTFETSITIPQAKG